MVNELFLVGIIQGLIISFVAYGIMIPFRLLNFADMSCEGSYPFAGAVCAFLLLHDIGPVLATIIATISAGLIGVVTAIIYLRFKLNSLLAGIIASTMFYSISLRVMGKPNIALFKQELLFSGLTNISIIMLLFALVAFFSILFYLFLKTEIGLRFRAIGFNLEFAKRQNISEKFYIILGLFLANCYNGIAGSLLVQLQSYADIAMGAGMLIHGLAALMIGECLLGNNSLKRQLLAPLVGGLIYQQIQGLVLSLGFAPSDLKFITASIVLLVIALRNRKT